MGAFTTRQTGWVAGAYPDSLFESKQRGVDRSWFRRAEDMGRAANILDTR